MTLNIKSIPGSKWFKNFHCESKLPVTKIFIIHWITPKIQEAITQQASSGVCGAENCPAMGQRRHTEGFQSILLWEMTAGVKILFITTNLGMAFFVSSEIAVLNKDEFH